MVNHNLWGNDPCEFCKVEKGQAFNDGGEWLCPECIGEWAADEGYSHFEFHGGDKK